jgi:hypothetical protein
LDNHVIDTIIEVEQETPASEFEYDYNQDLQGINISKYTGIAPNVRIPCEIDKKPVVSIGRYAFDKSGVVSCHIPNSVTHISAHSFRYCRRLKSVTIPENMTNISEYLFFDCPKLPPELLEHMRKIEDNRKKDAINNETNELICELLNLIISDNNEICFNGEQIRNNVNRLVFLILYDVEQSYREPGWTRVQRESIQITRENGKEYIFHAFKGHQFGGSETYEEEELKMISVEDNKEYILYSYSQYMR